MQPEIIKFKPTYQKDSGLGVINVADVPLPTDLSFPEHSVVYIPPTQLGGNHKHPRMEAFVAFGEGLELHWLDEAGAKHVEQMIGESGTFLLFIIPSMLPHAVINNSTTQLGFLMEFASEAQHNVETVKLI